MRNFKKVIALVLALALTMSTFTVAFAAEKSNAEMLSDLGLLTDITAEALEAELTREIGIAIVLKALGFSQEAATAYAAENESPFTDDDASWSTGFATFAAETGITNGVSATSFGPKDALTSKMFVTWMLRALGYDAAEAWSDTDALAEAAGLGEVAEGAYTKEDAAAVMFAALTAVDQATGLTLAEVLIAAEVITAEAAVEAGVYTVPVPAELAVTSVTATNAKEVVVTYNKAVDETEGKKVANYTVTKADDSDLTVSAVVLSEDKTTATLTLTTAMVNYSTDNKVKVLKAVGLAADYSGTVGVSDATIPTLVSAVASGPREITLTFSEPVTGATNAAFSLDNGTVALGAVTAAGTKLTLATLSDLSEGSHSLTLKANSAIVDHVGLVVKPGNYAFDYAKDTTIPTVTVKESSEYTVTLKFSKNVSNVNTAAVLFSHTYDGQNQVLGDAAITTVAADEYVVTFVNALAPGTSNVYIGYATGTTDANKIKDNFGNVLPATTLQVTTAVDNIAPVAETVVFKTSTTAEVNFSEKVTTATAQDKTNYTLKDSTGTAVTISGAVLDATAKKVTLTFTAINGGDYTLTVKNVKDISIAANKVADTTLTFTATDKVNPTITDVDTLTVGTQAQKVATKKVIVKFSEAMDVASITNKANYLLNSVALATGDTIEAIDSNKSALITFAADPGANDLTVGRVADAAGNLTTAFSSIVKIPADVSAPLYDKAEVIGKNSVKLYFKEVITGAVAKDFAVDPGDNTFDAVTGIAVTVADGKTEITLTIADNIAASAAAAGDVNVQSVADASVNAAVWAAAGSAANSYGAKVKVGLTAAVVAADKMAPSVVTNGYETADIDADGKIDHIKVTFDEAIFAGSVSMDKFTVAGYTVQDAYAVSAGAPNAATGRAGATVGNGTVVYVEVKELDNPDGAAIPKVTIAAGVKDVAGNAFAAVTDKDSIDKVAVTLISAQVSAGGFDAIDDTLVLTFSEDIAFGDEIVATASTLVNVNDWLLVDYDGATGDEVFVGAATFDIAISGKVATITLKGATLAEPMVVGTTEINLSDLSNIVDKATVANASVANATVVVVSAQ